jgi:uncharacterized Ntn-hydrolase superfamily protein
VATVLGLVAILGTRWTVMTFSIVARNPDGPVLGVAVASRFLAAGAYVPAAAVVAGAVATQAYGNLALRTDGIALLGGDPRGKQAAAVVVVSPGGGYGGLSDRCEGEHARQVVDDMGAPAVVALEEDLGVAGGEEPVAGRLQLPAQLLVVVDAAVEHHGQA